MNKIDLKKYGNLDKNPHMDDVFNQYLVFQSGAKLMAVKLSELRSIVPWRGITPVPGSPSEYMGVTSLRGTIIPIVNFAYLLTKNPETKPSPFIVIIRDEDENLGIPVDGILKIVVLREEEILPVQSSLQADNPEWFTGIFKFREQYGLILNIGTMFTRNVDVIDEEER